MTAEAQKILEQALTLPEEQREVLIEALSDSLSPSPVELNTEWKEEIQNRIAQVERGEVEPVPWSEVKADIQQMLGKK